MTAGNSTPLTDGAAAILLSTEDWARKKNLPILAYLTFTRVAAVNFIDDEGLLMAPAYAVSDMLKQADLRLQDFDFYEIHEAFAAPAIATLKAWQSEDFCRERLGRNEPMGPIDLSKMNVRGGSVAVGHPFAATGARIIATMAKLLNEQGGRPRARVRLHGRWHGCRRDHGSCADRLTRRLEPIRMGEFSAFLAELNAVLWHEYVLYAIVGTGILFTIWSGFCQYRALTHGPRVIRGVYDDPDDPGAINHFQALSAALSATVGLGNIGGVALAIALGGPGAIFWMWVIGFLGMAIKLTEVTMSMLYRNTDDPDNPHGGPMWVACESTRTQEHGRLGRGIGIMFCIMMLVSTSTGGNMFQAWNVGELTQTYFGVPSWITGMILAILVGAVIIGGIKRIGKVTGDARADHVRRCTSWPEPTCSRSTRATSRKCSR